MNSLRFAAAGTLAGAIAIFSACSGAKTSGIENKKMMIQNKNQKW